MSDVVPPQPGSHGGRSVDETETLHVCAASPMPEASPTAVGASVSRYVVLEEVGRGSMGRVLRAYDPKLQREIGLKEVRRDVLDEEATGRLVAEARAMAKLSHPHVVAVYDVEEVSTGGVVLVMEYVPGQTLSQWLREEGRPWREVIQRFVDAGRGLAAAHEAGLLHRDFKPANILVARTGTVKVTDFGLAKASTAVSQDISVEPDASADDLTADGTVMGTPRYMAPEQHRGQPLSAAADQYAFCVALWEALCGAPPFSGKAMARDKEAGPPKWRNADTPGPIVEAVTRGLAPDPQDRWPSMQALLEALCWDPARRRNRMLLGLGGLGVLLMAGVSYQAWAQARAQRCSGAHQHLAGVWDDDGRAQVQVAFEAVGTSYAEHAWTRTKEALDAYASEWVQMHTEACEATTVRGEQSPQMLDLRMACLHRAAVELGATARVLGDADETVVQKAHELTGALRPVSRCADTEELAADVEPPEPAEAEAVEGARQQLAEAKTLVQAGRYGEAKSAVEEARLHLEGVEYGPVQTELVLAEGDVLEKVGAYEASEAALVEALRRGSAWRQWDAMRDAATSLLAVVGDRQRRMEDGLRYRPMAEGLSQGDPEAEAGFRNNLAVVLLAQGKYAEAETEHRAALALREASLRADHPDVASSRNNLALVLARQGKYTEAETEHRAVLAQREASLGPDHPDAATSRNNLALVLSAQGKYAEAETEHRTALALLEASLGPDHPDASGSRNNLALVLLAQGRHTEAEAEYRAALAQREAALGPDHHDVAQSRHNLATVLLAQGRYAEAETALRAALAQLEASLGPDHPDVATSRSNLAGAYYAQGKYAEAETEVRTALAVQEASLRPDHPDIASKRHNLATVLLALDRPAEALLLAEQAWARRQHDDIPTEQRAETIFVLARTLWSVAGPARDRARARDLAHHAVTSYREAGEAYDEEAREVQRWLDEHRVP